MWAGFRLTGALLATGMVVAIAGCGSTHRTASPRVTPPACAAAVARETPAHNVRTSFVSVGGRPFGIATAPAGGWSFLADARHRALDVLSDLTFAPRLFHRVALHGEAVGDTITRDGRYVLVAGGSGAAVVDAARAEQGRAGAVLGELRAPGGEGGAIEVATSRDGRFVFVSLEAEGRLAVFNLAAALAHQFRGSDFVGEIPMGLAPVGMAVSPDGRWLYATSEGASGLGGFAGTVSVIDVRRAEADPQHAVTARAPAGCSPVRVAVSADGRTVWVTARESDRLLAFSAAALRRPPGRALRAAVLVGDAPVGLALVDHDSRVVVADSNRFGRAGGNAQLTVVNAAAALAGRPAVAGSLPAGLFPREEAAEPGGRTLLIGNFASGQLEAVDVSRLP